jgi:hypothetical protein
MDAYRRRIYYDLSSGEVLYNHVQRGYLLGSYTPEQEAAALGLANWGVFTWDKPDPEIEAAFAPFDAEGNPRIVTVTVDVAAMPPALQFAYAAPSEPETGDDPYEIIDILSGEV